MDRWFNRLWAEDGQVMMKYAVLAFLIVAGYVFACVWVWRVQGWSVWFGLLVTPLVVWAVGIVGSVFSYFGRKVCFYFSCRHETIDGYKWSYSIIDNHAKVLTVSPLKGVISIPPTLGQSPVTIIANGAFSDCSSLTSVTIPSSVTHIEAEAFRDCSGLTSVTIPDSVTIISEGAFHGCSGLTSVTIPDSVTIISKGAFQGCSGLTSVTIPDSVTIISDGAFFECSRLTRVTIGKGVRSIGEFAFIWCGNQMCFIFNGEAPEFDIDPSWGFGPFDEGCTLFVHRGATGWDGLDSKFNLPIQYIDDAVNTADANSQPVAFNETLRV